MPKILVSSIIHADSERLFTVVREIGRFSQFMKFVKSVEVKESRENRVISEWTIDIDGTPIKWTEEDVADLTNKTMSFCSLKGDYSYAGKWKVIDLGNGQSKVTIEALFDWGVPNFEQHFGKVYENKARLALIGMLRAIKKEIEHG